MTPEFSFPHRLGASEPRANTQFAVFLTEEEGQSEIALGGHNANKLASPLLWAPVALQEMGYWQVYIKEVRINGKALPACEDGTCRGIVDTGTSHLGVPGPQLREFVDLLSVDVSDPIMDCRKTTGPTVEFVLNADLSLKLHPVDYMRPLSLDVGTNVGLSSGKPVLAGVRTQTASSDSVMTADANGQVAKVKTCTPRAMPVNLPAPLGPKLFIMGEPLLSKYYTVYDWEQKKVGFGLAAGKNQQKAHIPEDETSFVQVTITLRTRVSPSC